MGTDDHKCNRPRLRCTECKKSRIKCDYHRPVCSNCSRTGKKCDYSLTLKWGGRPYKNPKIEKLNTVANLSYKQLASKWKAAPTRAAQFTFAKTSVGPSLKGATEPRCAVSKGPKSTKDLTTTDPLQPWLVDIVRQNIPTSTRHLDVHHEFIPPSLMSFPDFLLNVPLYYEAFSVFCNNTSIYFTVADPHVYVSNPMRLLLPCVGMADRGMLAVVIAFGLVHRSKMMQIPIPVDSIDHLLENALKNLASQPLNDSTVPLAIMLSSFRSISLYPKRPLLGIHHTRRILVNAGYQKPFKKLLEEVSHNKNESQCDSSRIRLLYCVIRWFAYVDTFSVLSTTLEPFEQEVNAYIESKGLRAMEFGEKLESYISAYFADQLDYEYPDEASEAFSQDESFKGIDFLLGFSPKLLATFSKLERIIWFNNLMKKVHDQQQKPNSVKLQYSPGPAIIERAIDLEAQFKQFIGVIPVNYKDHEVDSFNSLTAANCCFCLMGLIHLYRRVLMIPQRSHIVQNISVFILDLVRTFFEPSKSVGAIGMVLPLFVGGCECNNSMVRQQYIETMHSLSLDGYPSFKLMESCWSTGESWYNIDHTGDIIAILG